MELFKNTNFDFLGKKWPFIGASLVLTVAGLASLAIKGGPDYGIDFKGGALMYLRFNQEPPVQKIRAALDVYDREPLPVGHPLRSAPNTVLMPHMGYCTKETWDTFYPQMIENALAFMDGKPVRVTNPEVLKG